MMSKMQKVVNELEEWGLTQGLRFNAQKTEVIVFSKATKIEMPNKLRVGGQNIPYGTQAKYLGILLDSKLSWKPHMDRAITKAKQYIFMLCKGVSQRWGPGYTYMKWIYTAVIKPLITYACIVWAHPLKQTTYKSSINKVGRLMVAILSNTRQSTPRDALGVMFGIPPLDLDIQKEAISSIARNRHMMTLDWPGNLRDKPSYVGHLKYWETIAEANSIDIDFCDRNRLTVWSRDFYLDKNSFNSTGLPIQSQINIFTDGSKTDEHSGSGFVIDLDLDLVYSDFD